MSDAPKFIPAGWTPKAWVARLRQLAHACHLLNPELSERHTLTADQWETWIEQNPDRGNREFYTVE